MRLFHPGLRAQSSSAEVCHASGGGEKNLKVGAPDFLSREVAVTSAATSEVRMEIEPLWNRLLLFWSDDRSPHEVLSACKDRDLDDRSVLFDGEVTPTKLSARSNMHARLCGHGVVL